MTEDYMRQRLEHWVTREPVHETAVKLMADMVNHEVECERLDVQNRICADLRARGMNDHADLVGSMDVRNPNTRQ